MTDPLANPCAAPSIAATAALLREVFPGAPVGSPEYLDWLYCRNPLGRVIEENLDDAAGRAGHYAVVPTALRASGRRQRAVLSLNTAVHERARRGGVFVRLAELAYAQADRDGAEAVIGVANANSTPGFIRRLGFQLVCPLPVRIWARPVRRPRAIDAVVADRAAIGDEALWRRLAPLFEPSPPDISVAWDRASFAWRLASPRGPYTLHIGSDAAAVSTVATINGVRVAVVLKLLPTSGLHASNVRDLIRSACRAHRAPAALHAGLAAGLPAGLPLPARLKPSPLNLIFRALGEGRESGAAFGAFEFLDFDAY